MNNQEFIKQLSEASGRQERIELLNNRASSFQSGDTRSLLLGQIAAKLQKMEYLEACKQGKGRS